MKRTLAISLFLALAVGTNAQTPTVVEKPAPKPAPKSAASSTKPNVQAPTTAAKPSPGVKVVAGHKTAPATVKPAVVAVQPATTKPAVTAAKPGATPTAKIVAVPTAKTNMAATVKPVVAGKPMPKPAVSSAHALAGAPGVQPLNSTKPAAVTVKGSPAKTPFAAAKAMVKAQPVSAAKTTVAVKDNNPVATKKPIRKISAAGRRDPFVSPVVTMAAMGSGCSSGKRCLAIDQIALRGVVKSDNGMIAVVVNAMDKAYFLRENDPVFNGYVVKITGDSIVFKETFKDKLGKPLTRDVTKSINRPVA